MARRNFNRAAKVKRIQNLFLGVLSSLVIPLSAFVSEWWNNGMTKHGVLMFVATSSGILIMGISVAIATMQNELLKKRKNSSEKAVLGTLLGAYILLGVLLYSQVPEKAELTSNIEQTRQIAEFVAYYYLAGPALAAASIIAGGS